MQQQLRPKTQQVQFLEEWLRNNISITTATTKISYLQPLNSSSSILQSWADLRNPSIRSQPHRLLSSLQNLSSLPPSSLHLSLPQSQLLLTLLSSSSSPPSSSTPLISRLFSIYIRKTPNPPPQFIDSLLNSLPLLCSPPSPFALLLLGSLSASPSLSEPSRGVCLDLFCRILEEGDGEKVWEEEERIPEALAGIGYALIRADNARFTRILGFLLRGKQSKLEFGLIVVSLVEWVVLGFVDLGGLSRIESLCGMIAEGNNPSRFGVLMASCGVLRAFRLSSGSSRVKINEGLRNSMEGVVGSIAGYVVASDDKGKEKGRFLQGISLGLVRSGPISFSPPVFLCVCSALLNEIFPLRRLFKMSIDSSANAIEKVKQHMGCILFKEAGAVTGVLCNQYTMADEEHKAIAENYMWEYSQALYFDLRKAILLLQGKNDDLIGNLEKIAEAAFLMVVVFAAEVTKHKLNSKSLDQFRPEVAVKILVAFSCIEYLRRVRLPEYTEAVRRAVLTIQENATACALFVESLPPYAEITNQNGTFALDGMRYVWWEDEVQTARLLFCLRVMPTCISLVPASVFGMLVAPTMFLYMRHPNEKVARASHSVFVAFMSSAKDSEQDDRSALKEQLVFYYIQRSLEAYPGVTPFEGLASGVAALVRHLPAGSPAIFYCIHSLVEKATDLCSRALSEDATMWKNWEGNSEPCKKVIDLLLRLTALVDIQGTLGLYSALKFVLVGWGEYSRPVDLVVDNRSDLVKVVVAPVAATIGASKPTGLTLDYRSISETQVLPYLLKQLAEFVVQLPNQGQNVLLNEMYAQVAESDDVTRKPVLVSWLQSLSYLCSQKKTAFVGRSGNASDGSLELNRSNARL